MLVNLDHVLYAAKKAHYGVGLFNTITLEEAKGVLAAAEELHCPVIIGTAQVLLPYADLKESADILIPMAKRADVPVVVHFDHGLTFEKCMEALQLGFSSIMYDCSKDPYEENVKKVAELVKIAHAFGATVEGELGHVGNNEGSDVLSEPEAYYTDPAQAKDFYKKTGVDALAVAVGTAHGAYKFPPKLDFARITQIAEAVPIPLVLHGGSGLRDEDFRTAIQKGISKINIFTDLDRAAADGVRQAFAEGKDSMTQTMPYQTEFVKKAVMKKMQLFLCGQEKLIF